MKASVRTLVYTGLLVVLLAGPAGIARAQQLNWTLDPLDPNDPLAQPIIYAANKDLTVLYGMYGTLNSGSLFRWTEANGFTNIIGSAPTYNVNYVSYTRPVSDDGLKLIVFGPAIGGSSVYTWTEADGLTHIAAPSVTHTFYNAVNISGDGSAFALTAMDGSNGAREAFHWRDGVGLTNLGSLGGTPHAVVYDINYDGSVIVGNSMNAMVATEAFIWKEGIGMTGLGLMGGVYSDAIKVSDDGRFVAGYTDTQVFRWEDGGNVEMLSFAPGNYGFSESMTRDGRYIIGYEADGVTSELFGFRWDVDTNDYTLLGGIAGSQSYTTPTEISDDGGVIIGETYDLNTNIPYNFYWSEDTGFKTFEELLTDAGVDLTGWLLHGGIYPNPAFLSADGTKIVAMGYKDFTATSYIMTLQGITTPQDMAQDFIPATSAGRQVTNSVGSGLGQSLLAARQALPSFMQQQARASYGSLPGPRSYGSTPREFNDVGPAAGESYAMRERRERMSRTSFYAFGTYGVGQNNDFDNNEGSGATGLFMRLGDDLAVGVGVVSSKSNTELRLGGNSDVETIGGAVNLAYETGEGLRLYATATVTDLSVDMKRNYVNGGGTDSSRGETNGIAYGAAVRAGWSFPVNEKTSVMPYAEVQASRANLDAYTETGGAFPATFNKQTANFVTSRVGAEFSHDLSDNVELRMRAAWGHQWNGDNNTLTGSVLGINQTVPYTTGDKDWAEAGTTVIWQATDRTNFYADLSGRYGKTAEPAAVASFGITIGF